MVAWRACQSAPLGIADFRAWLACHEIKARRCVLDEQRPPNYDHPELARLCGVSAKRARASVNRLVTAGLLEWSESAIGFPELVLDDDDLADSIGGGRGLLYLPRRMLRFLAHGARPALIATVLAILLRCLSRRRGGFDGRGRVKASWIARVFGVDLRRVKAARLELVALGWIDPEPTDQRAENRWGRAYRIDLGWDRPDGRRLPPPDPPDRPAIATPSVDQEPLPERQRNQEPAPGGSTGASLGGWKDGEKPLPKPRLDDVRIEDLKDTGRLLELLDQAIGRELVGPSEADRLKFLAAAEHARGVGKTNPAGLFAFLVRGGHWRYITQADEDRANARLKAYLRGPVALPVAAREVARPVLSEDARVVREVRRSFAAAGYRGDPYPHVRRHDPSWTRERWDAALGELGLGQPPLNP
jgi:hypothetical protein